MVQDYRKDLNPASYAQAFGQLTLRYERLLKELSLLSQLNDIQLIELNTEQLCHQLAEAMASELDVENCSLMLLHCEGDSLELRAASSPLDEGSKAFLPGAWTGKRFQIGEGIVGRAAKHRQSIHIEDVRQDASFVPLQNSTVEVASLLCIPLLCEGELLGVVNFSHYQPGFFDIELRGMLEIIANSIARILAKHKLYRKLLESETRYRLVADHAGDGIVVFDSRGKVLSINPAAERMTGVPADRFISGEIQWEAGICDEDREPFVRNLEKALRSTNAEMVSYQYVDTQKQVHYLEQISSPMRDESGHCVGVVAVVRDITARKQAEMELSRLAMAVEHAAESILITDSEGTLLYVNPAFEQMTGYTREEVIGNNPRLLKSGKHERPFYQELWDTLQQGKSWAGHIINKKKDGTLYEEDGTISPVKDASGRITNFVAVKRDVTREVQIESRLRQGQKLEAIGTLAGGIAHDFNNLLTIIIGFGEILKGGNLQTEQVQTNLDYLLEAATRAKDLIHRILTFSQEVDVELKPISIHAIVKESLKLLRATIPSTIEIVQNLDPLSGTVLADPTQIQQVVINLCTNAYQAMEQTGGTLKVDVSCVEVDHHLAAMHPRLRRHPLYVRILVSDSGHGMDRATLERVFDPFFTTKEKGKGTGLGLAMVHGIVAGLNGEITVTSEPDKGTTFHVYLPRMDAPEIAPEESREDAPSGKGETVLLVDDEKAVLEVGEQMLERLGYKVVAVSNSLEALDLFRSQFDRFDIVLTDHTMPKLTGCQLASEMASICPNLPIVIMTGLGQTLTPQWVQQSGVHSIVGKPFSLEELAKVIREALDQTSPQ